MQQITTLIPCSDFVLQTYSQNHTDTDMVCMMVNYAKFLQRPLELWMLVPCGDDGKPLSEPDEFFDLGYHDESKADYDVDDWKREHEAYQAAKDRCLFEGLRHSDNVLWHGDEAVWISDLIGNIETIIELDVLLCPTSLKEIYGS